MCAQDLFALGREKKSWECVVTGVEDAVACVGVDGVAG